MDLWAPVVGHAAVVFPILEHAGQRGDAQACDFLARLERGVDLHDQRGGRRDIETASPSDAR
jgi:hypothetical protein